MHGLLDDSLITLDNTRVIKNTMQQILIFYIQVLIYLIFKKQQILSFGISEHEVNYNIIY